MRAALACIILVALVCAAFGMWELAGAFGMLGVVVAVPGLRDYWFRP